MIQLILFLLLSGVALVVQGSILTTPLVLGILIAFTVIRRKLWIFGVAFVFGLLLDILTIRSLGLESIYFLLVVMFVFLYEHKFEIATKEFVGLFSFFAGFVYCLVFSSSGLFLPAFLTSVVGIGSFFVFKKLG